MQTHILASLLSDPKCSDAQDLTHTVWPHSLLSTWGEQEWCGKYCIFIMQMSPQCPLRTSSDFLSSQSPLSFKITGNIDTNSIETPLEAFYYDLHFSLKWTGKLELALNLNYSHELNYFLPTELSTTTEIVLVSNHPKAI